MTSTPTVTSNTDIVRAFMERMTARDVDGALSYLSSDITVWEPPELPYGGTFVGHDGFRDFVAAFGRTWRSWRDGDYTYADVGGVTFKENHFSATARGSDAEVSMHLVEVFYLRHGQITGIRPHYWDVAAVVAALA